MKGKKCRADARISLAEILTHFSGATPDRPYRHAERGPIISKPPTISASRSLPFAEARGSANGFVAPYKVIKVPQSTETGHRGLSPGTRAKTRNRVTATRSRIGSITTKKLDRKGLGARRPQPWIAGAKRKRVKEKGGLKSPFRLGQSRAEGRLEPEAFPQGGWRLVVR